MLEYVTIFGATLGIAAFVWKIWDAFANYLHIALDVVECGTDYVLAKVTVENRSLRPKRIDNALLLVGPEDDDPIECFNVVAAANGIGIKALETDDIAEFQSERSLHAQGGRAVIPLPFFFLENVRIADERLSYRAPIRLDKMNSGNPYSVRFFVWGKWRLHRSTHDSFVAP